MLDFIARRLVSIIPVLAVVAIFVFLMLRLTPGDPAAVIAGDNATSDQIADIRTKLGLDEPKVRFGDRAARARGEHDLLGAHETMLTPVSFGEDRLAP